MGRPRKIVETPGQENAASEEKTSFVEEGQLITTEQAAVGQNVATLLDGTQLAERNAILATLNAQGATIVARFEELGFTDLTDQNLTDNLEFLTLVRKATDATNGSAGAMVTNEEGKPQPVRGAPVLTEHGWHVPG